MVRARAAVEKGIQHYHVDRYGFFFAEDQSTYYLSLYDLEMGYIPPRLLQANIIPPAILLDEEMLDVAIKARMRGTVSMNNLFL